MKVLFIGFLYAALIYLTTAYIQLSFDIRAWDESARFISGLGIFFTFAFSVLIHSFLNDEKK